MELAAKLCTTDTRERLGNRQRLQRIKQSDYDKLQTRHAKRNSTRTWNDRLDFRVSIFIIMSDIFKRDRAILIPCLQV